MHKWPLRVQSCGAGESALDSDTAKGSIAGFIFGVKTAVKTHFQGKLLKAMTENCVIASIHKEMTRISAKNII